MENLIRHRWFILISLSFLLGSVLTLTSVVLIKLINITPEKRLSEADLSNISKTIENGFENRIGNVEWTTLHTNQASNISIIRMSDGIKMHKHKFEDHHLYILSGSAKSITMDGEVILKEGDYVYFPKEKIHALEILDKKPIIFLQFSIPNFNPTDIIWQ